MLPIEEDELSSSLLRICKYPVMRAEPTDSSAVSAARTHTDKSDSAIAFGSHTDTSFVTIGCSNSEAPGMEIFDQQALSWVAVEDVNTYASAHHLPARSSSVSVTVFAGEFLEMMTGHLYKAAVHRVRAPKQEGSCRISCPFLIRGRDRAVVGPCAAANGTVSQARDEGQVRPQIQLRTDASPEAQDTIFRSVCAQTKLPDLSGNSMKLLHKILDFKRAKCVKANEDNTSDWVLKAY
jgi:isopenicillin N synthase-like dioxygenase